MRNLKRVLSLSLASVMLFGMMVIGSSAASAAKGYPDVDKDAHNIEAIDVLQTIEVMIGYTEEEGGGFQPNKPVTRAEMMVIMAKLLDLDYNYYSATCPFTDVPEWARGYVGAAYANKVAVGRGDGIFDPNSPVTPVEASAFLMRALGYFQYSNDYANGFELETVTQGSKIGIYDGVSSSASEPMTRNQVAKMVLNTLESGMVQPDGNTINLTTPDGSVLTGKVNYVYVTSNKDFATSISSVQATSMGSTNGGYIVEMGEQLYNGDLKLFDGRLDVFGRPSRYWEYDGKGIGTYMKKELMKEEYTTKVTGKALYELLGSDVVKDYEFTITIDGETDENVLDTNQFVMGTLGDKSKFYFDTTALNRTNTNQVGGTGNGVLTQVFVDGNKHEVYISIINTYLAIADSDYNTNKGEAYFTIYNVSEVTLPGNGYVAYVKDSADPDNAVKTNREASVSNVTVYNEDIDVANVQDGDVVLVYLAEHEIQEIMTPDVIDSTTISAFKPDSYVVTPDGQINYASTAMYDIDALYDFSKDNMKDATFRIYLDRYGYLIGLEEIESEAHYVFLTGINSTTENLRDQTAIGNVIFLDGTSANVTINMKKSENSVGNPFLSPSGAATYDGTYGIRTDTKVSALMNTWCTYSVNESGIYTLTEVPRTAGEFAQKPKAGQSHMGGTWKDAGGDVYYYADNTAAANTPSFTVTGANDDDAGSKPFGDGGADSKYVEINKGSVALAGIAGSPWRVVYGNNDTIYMTAEVEYLSNVRDDLLDGTQNNAKAVVITGADTVAVGVQDVDMSAKNAQAVVESLGTDRADAISGAGPNGSISYVNVSDGVYTLFDEEGYVIAAMVVGADEGTNTSYAWVSSTNMNREGLVNGEWEYSRDVIINGEKVTLTERQDNGTATPQIANRGTDPTNAARQGYWWEVKTKADGTVKEANRINAAWTSANSNHQYIYDIDQDTNSYGKTRILTQAFGTDKDSGTNLYRDSGFIPTDAAEIDPVGTTYTVRVIGNTLQVEGDTGKVRGFAVNENAKIVLVKDEETHRNGSLDYNYKANIEYFDNNRSAAGLKQAVNRMTNSGRFVGYISAILVDGRAESVIIYDKTPSDVTIREQVTDNSKVFAVEVDGKFNVYYIDKDIALNPANGIRLTAAMIEDAIYSHLVNIQKLNVEKVTYESTDAVSGKAIVVKSGETRGSEWPVIIVHDTEATYAANKLYWDTWW